MSRLPVFTHRIFRDVPKHGQVYAAHADSCIHVTVVVLHTVAWLSPFLVIFFYFGIGFCYAVVISDVRKAQYMICRLTIEKENN